MLLVPALRRLTPAGTFRARAGLPAAVLSRGLLTFAFFAGDAYVPLMLTSIRHTSPTYAGFTLTVSTVAWTAGAWAQARAMARRGPRRLIAIGLGLVIAGLVAMASLLWHAVPTWVAPAAWTVAGFGIGLAYTPISVTALALARPGEEGRVSSSVQLSDVLGTAFGTGVAGAAVAIVHRARVRSPAGAGPGVRGRHRRGAIGPGGHASAASQRQPGCSRSAQGKRRADSGVGPRDDRNSRDC